MSEPKVNPAPPEKLVTFWDITAKQFRKNKVAMVALYCVIGLVVVATCAPLLAMNIPYVMKAKDGLSFPLFSHLFNRLVFPSGVDVFFNLLLVIGPVWWLGSRVVRASGIEGDARDANRLLAYSIPLGLLLLFLLTLAIMAHSIYWWMLGGALSGLAFMFVLSGRMRSMQERNARLVRNRARFGLFGFFMVGFVLTMTELHYTSAIPTYRDVIANQGKGEWALKPLSFNHPTNVSEDSKLVVARKLRGPSWSAEFNLGTKAKPRMVTTRIMLGTDLNGRDAFSRILFGTRISLTIGIIAVSIYVTIGIILGGLAGYFGGKVDTAILFALQVMICIPSFFLLLTIVAVFETRSVFMIMIAIGLVSWTGITRVVRGEFLRQRNADYVMAARALGIPERRIIFGHILKNALSPILVMAAFGVAGAILIESGLAFIGLGDTTAPSWGQMLTIGKEEGKAWLIYAPGMAIFFVVLVLNMVGDGLRDALDPKLRQ